MGRDLSSTPHLPVFSGIDELTVLRFLGMFRNGRSAAKYITAVRFLHQCAGSQSKNLYSDRVLRALQAAKGNAPPPRRANAIHLGNARDVASLAWARHEPVTATQSVLAYIFGFRVQNELMPVEWDALPSGGHSSLRLYPGAQGRPMLEVSLRSRKNEPTGAVLVRPCTCAPWANDPFMCPVHTLKRYMRDTGRLPTGRLFPGNPESLYVSFVRRIRFLGGPQCLNIPNAAEWTSHGFRRGMAQDILDNGGSLAEILRAGGWKSAAFLLYLERTEVDQAAVLDCLFAADVRPSEAALARVPREVRELIQPMPCLDSETGGASQAPALLPVVPVPAPRACPPPVPAPPPFCPPPAPAPPPANAAGANPGVQRPLVALAPVFAHVPVPKAAQSKAVPKAALPKAKSAPRKRPKSAPTAQPKPKVAAPAAVASQASMLKFFPSRGFHSARGSS